MLFFAALLNFVASSLLASFGEGVVLSNIIYFYGGRDEFCLVWPVGDLISIKLGQKENHHVS